jgi:phosphomannomutase
LNQYRAEELLDIYHQGEFRRARDRDLKKVKKDDKAFSTHLNAILKYVDRDRIARQKFRVALDCVNGAGAGVAQELLEALGCECMAIHTDRDKPFPHNPEPLAENLTDLVALAKTEKVDIAFAQDADADRLALVSPVKGAIGEEYTVVLATKQVLKKRPGPVVVNLSTSMLVEDVARQGKSKVYRTSVGEINVTEKLLSVNGVCGGEGNGGVIIPEIHPCRDSFAGMAVILQLLAEEEKSLDEIVDSLPKYSIVKSKIPCPSESVFGVLRGIEKRFDNGATRDRTDGIRLAWRDRWLQVRASNTEPILRIIAEASEERDARSLMDQALKEISRLLGTLE